MRNFPINLLATVQSVIGKQEYFLLRYNGRVKNEAGFHSSSFEDPVKMLGSVQPVNTRNYKEMGLDFKKKYIKIYDVNLINAMSRNENQDKILWNGYEYSVIENNDWNIQGGWNFVLCVRLEKIKE